MIDDHETYSYGEDLDCPSGKGAFCTGRNLTMQRIVLQKIGNSYKTLNDSENSTKTESPPCFGDAGETILHYVQPIHT